MDTSKKYIKTCEKAKEIQDNWEILNEDYVYNKIWNISRICMDGFNLGSCVWLPRQDQLQDMIKWNKKWYKGAYLYPLIDFYESFAGNQWESLEQLWLAFVMYEKYQKIWDEEKEEWVKE